jgi:hypothetical protein
MLKRTDGSQAAIVCRAVKHPDSGSGSEMRIGLCAFGNISPAQMVNPYHVLINQVKSGQFATAKFFHATLCRFNTGAPGAGPESFYRRLTPGYYYFIVHVLGLPSPNAPASCPDAMAQTY